MQKLANISSFESLMNGSVPSYNSVFNKEYPKPTRPFRDSFKQLWDMSGYSSIPWWGYLLLPPLAIEAMAVLGVSGAISAAAMLKHPLNNRRHAKKIEEMIKGLMAEGKKHEGYKSFYELMDDFYEKKRMNRDQYVQLLKDLFWGNKIYRSTDYDDPKFKGEEPFEYEGETLAGLAEAPLSLLLGKKEDDDIDGGTDTDKVEVPARLLHEGKPVKVDRIQ